MTYPTVSQLSQCRNSEIRLVMHLARQLAGMLGTDPSGGFEETSIPDVKDFPGQILIQDREKALEVGHSSQEGLVL